MIAPHPLVFEPMVFEKVWGGRRLERFGKRLPHGALFGESWEVADLAVTSTSGAGGGEAKSIIANGPLRGRTLADAMRMWNRAMLDDAKPAGSFPLLIKYLDAREHLSVQVHPSPAYAAVHPDAHLKTECWYVLDAEPGSVIFKGLRAGVMRADVERALRTGQGEGIVPLLEAVPAIIGECHDLPSGTLHALGGGVLVAEVQTPSDTTFRVYDWAKELGRGGRALHIEQALACIDFGPPPPTTRGIGERTRLVHNEFFDLDELRPGRGGLALEPRCCVLMVVRGEISLRHGQRTDHHALGTTILVPSAIAGDVTIRGDGATVLCAMVR